MSHGTIYKGTLVTQIELTNGGYVSSEDIITKFSNTNCVNLNQKPKIFIFPVCRGDHPDRENLIRRENIGYDGPGDYEAEPNTYATFSDMLICYATVPGKVKYLNDFKISYSVVFFQDSVFTDRKKVEVGTFKP